jgi:hypothetical protein
MDPAPAPAPVHELRLNGPEAVLTIHVPPVEAGLGLSPHPVADRLPAADGVAVIRDLCLVL